MNPDINGQEEQTRWGIPVDWDLQTRLLECLRGCVTPQRSKDIASAFKKHVFEVEEHLDILAESKLVQYRPIEGAAWGWIAPDLRPRKPSGDFVGCAFWGCLGARKRRFKVQATLVHPRRENAS
jgi:hypothetical protein